MWEKAGKFWGSLTERQRTFVLVVGSLLVAAMVASYVFRGTDWSAVLPWI